MLISHDGLVLAATAAILLLAVIWLESGLYRVPSDNGDDNGD
jgi:hypothetical protein